MKSTATNVLIQPVTALERSTIFSSLSFVLLPPSLVVRGRRLPQTFFLCKFDGSPVKQRKGRWTTKDAADTASNIGESPYYWASTTTKMAIRASSSKRPSTRDVSCVDDEEEPSASNDTSHPQARARRGTTPSRARPRKNDAVSRAPRSTGDSEGTISSGGIDQTTTSSNRCGYGESRRRDAAAGSLSERYEDLGRGLHSTVAEDILRTTKEEDLALVLALFEEHESLLAVRERLCKELVVLQGEEDELRVSLGFPIVHPVTEPSSPPRSALETNANAFLGPRAVAPIGREAEPSVNSSGKRWRTAGEPHSKKKTAAKSAVVSLSEK